MAEGLKEMLTKQAMKLMQSETAMKLMQNQRFMNVVMQAFALRGKVQGAVDNASETVAHMLGFATKEEVQRLQAIIQDLESRLQTESKPENDNN